MLNFLLSTLRQKLKNIELKSNMRKPGNLMIKQIYRDWDIKHSKSFMIGDKKQIN